MPHNVQNPSCLRSILPASPYVVERNTRVDQQEFCGVDIPASPLSKAHQQARMTQRRMLWSQDQFRSET